MKASVTALTKASKKTTARTAIGSSLQAMLAWLAFSTAALGAPPAPEPGAMLREGHWVSDVGAYAVPQALENIKPANWPVDGWYRLTLRPRDVLVERAPSTAGLVEHAPSTAGAGPDFLRPIVKVLEAQAAARTSEAPPLSDAPEAPDRIYLRVPELRLPTGPAEAYVFRNGTTNLRPILDNRYELQLGQRAFAFTVRNGLRGKNGEAYGSGAQYTIEYDGNTYEYSLGEFGWDSTITAIADLDGDGKPDFIISVGGNNSGIDALLLSSQAKPGKNPPTASLFQIGC